ncbi:MAG: hypothetical protein H0U72_08030 [Nitrosospira sp.]|nr:hypothetical protein [Nitrosospira sp.]
MKTLKLLLLSTVITFCYVQASSAQRFYDKERDEQAQEAKKLADQIKSGSLFDKQARNLTALMLNDFAVYFMDARRGLRADLNTITTWADVDAIVKKASLSVTKTPQYSDPEIKDATDNLEKSLANAKQALKELTDKIAETDNQGLSALFGSLEGLASLKNQGDKLLSQKEVALVGDLIQNLENLRTVYETYNKRIKTIETELVELKIPLMQIAIDRLQIEEEHWTNIAAIQARRVTEEDEIKLLIDDYNCRTGSKPLNVKSAEESQLTDHKCFSESKPLNVKSAERVEETLYRFVQRKDRAQLVNTLLALYVATAIAARGNTPSKLVDVRLSQEEHLYSIRQSAVMARAYELTVSTGVQRLALFHKGGVKPETIAQVIHTLAAAAIPAAIILK